jgi:flagellar biosynthetic protein FliQ
MDSSQVFTYGQEALTVLLAVAAPMLVTILLVGLVISILQAATQLHEATLSFVPKVLAGVLVLLVAGPWMLTMLVEYLQRMLQAIPNAVG